MTWFFPPLKASISMIGFQAYIGAITAILDSLHPAGSTVLANRFATLQALSLSIIVARGPGLVKTVQPRWPMCLSLLPFCCFGGVAS